MNRIAKIVAIACVGVFASATAYAQVGGPDLPGKAKTTKASGKGKMSKHAGKKMMMHTKKKHM